MTTLAADFPHTVLPATLVTPADRLGLTAFLAIVAHAVVILGVVFVPHKPVESLFSTLDIVLVQHATKTAPDEADLLAQANQDGGGKAEPHRPWARPDPAPQPRQRDRAPAGPAKGLSPERRR